MPPASSWRVRLHPLLRKSFGLRHLREGQEAVIGSVMQSHPTLAGLPVAEPGA